VERHRSQFQITKSSDKAMKLIAPNQDLQIELEYPLERDI
jgi:hypothetical protein